MLATGYLPYWVVIPGGRISGMGGLNPDELEKVSRWTVENINTDGMRLVKVNQLLKARLHLPSLHNVQSSVLNYRREFASGFSAMYQFLIGHKR